MICANISWTLLIMICACPHLLFVLVLSSYCDLCQDWPHKLSFSCLIVIVVGFWFASSPPISLCTFFFFFRHDVFMFLSMFLSTVEAYGSQPSLPCYNLLPAASILRGLQMPGRCVKHYLWYFFRCGSSSLVDASSVGFLCFATYNQKE